MVERAQELREQIERYNGSAELKVTQSTLDALQRELVDVDMVSEMDAQDWVRLNIAVGEKKILMRFCAAKDKKDLWRPLPPPRVDYNIASWLGGAVLMLPACILGLVRDNDAGEGGYEQTGKTMFNVSTNVYSVFTTDDDDGFGNTGVVEFGGSARGGQVLIPALVLIIATMIMLAVGRMSLGKDLLQQASPGVSVREAQRSNLTNSGVVGALFLTVVLAMLQADAPLDDKWRLISQWYLIFNVVGMLYCFIATTLSVILLMYIEPLDDDASYMFVNANIDYFGEPVGCIIMAVIMFLQAAILWIFGQYEMECGIVSYFACVVCIQRVFLTYMYSAAWKNELLDEEEVALRKQRSKQNTVVNTQLKKKKISVEAK